MDLLLPAGTVLLHIGPHKTGTTSIQGALYHARPAMVEHGVIYPGRARQHVLAARAMTGSGGICGDRPATRRDWDRLVGQVAAARQRRVIVSSEFFCEATPEVARRVVDELGGPRVHVVVTVRPLAKILASAWQQYVRNRQRASYDRWLRGVLDNERQPTGRAMTPTFWRRHQHDVLVDRWAEIVGPENLTVVVVNSSDQRGLMESFEKLVGLPAGLLQPEESRSNRSLTFGEIELVRRVNGVFQRHGWSNEFYRRMVTDGVIRRMQTAREPGPGEPPITTPRWALERAGAIGAAAGEHIAARGVRVIGDLSALGTVPDVSSEIDQQAINQSTINQQTGANDTDPLIPADAAVKAITGVLVAAARSTHRPSSGGTRRPIEVARRVRSKLQRR